MQGIPDRPPSEQGGFSLIELAIALVLVAFLISGTVSGVASHQAQRRVHSERVLALEACRSTMEMLRSVDIALLPTYNGRGFDVLGQGGQPHGLKAIPGDLDGLPGEISVAVDRSSGPDFLYMVTARVRWQGITRGGDLAIQSLMGERR
jgi:prepilin-type N-terminal cleavage/methylation domain-containing protein